MREKMATFATEGLELPLGRTLLLLLLVPSLYLIPGSSPASASEDAFVGLVFGIASGLAAWVVFAPAAGWKRRLLIALAIASTSGVGYAWDRGFSWLVVAAVVGTYVDAALALSLLVFLLFKLTLGRGKIESDFQFGIKHLLAATLVVIPLAIMTRLAMPDFGRADIVPIIVVAADAMIITLAAQWLIGSRRLRLGELIGRTLLVLMIIFALGLLLPNLPVFQLQMVGWGPLQTTLGATILAGYLLPRLDDFVVTIRPRENVATDPQQKASYKGEGGPSGTTLVASPSIENPQPTHPLDNQDDELSALVPPLHSVGHRPT